MIWLEAIVLLLFVEAFVAYGRLSYVQGVLDRHHAPDSEQVRHVLEVDHGRAATRGLELWRS